MENSAPLSTLLTEVSALRNAGKTGDAIIRLQAKLEKTPAHYGGWLALSNLQFAAERYDEAIKAAKIAEPLDPLTAQFQRIQQAIQTRNGAAAKSIAQDMLRSHPGHPRAIFTLAHLCQSGGDFAAAIDLLNTGLQASPADLVLRAMKVGALEQAGRYHDAIEAAEAITKLDTGFVGLWRLANLLLRYGQNEAALRACDRLSELTNLTPSQQSAAALVRAQTLRIVGDREQSIGAFKESLALNRANANAWWGLADLKTYEFSQADRSELSALIARKDLHPQEVCMAAFARAKAEESTGDPASVITHYHKANQLHPDRQFNTAAFKAGIARIKDQVTAEALETQAPARPGSPRPIFILGLPRSGSTLVEQILASHSQVEGTIEQPTLPAIKQRAHLICARELGGSYLSRLGQLERSVLDQLGQAYLDESQLFRSEGAPFFTDKLPHNFEHVGLIHKILPDAVIVDTRRNPLDCGYSLYKQYFTQGTEFSYSLENIGHYYNGYLELMDHWHSVLPGRVLTLHYEALVSDPETEVRALLDHAGLEFETSCLDFHKTKRAVRTASSEQVRQPLNTKGVGTWKAVAAELEPLSKALGKATLDRFEL